MNFYLMNANITSLLLGHGLTKSLDLEQSLDWRYRLSDTPQPNGTYYDLWLNKMNLEPRNASHLWVLSGTFSSAPDLRQRSSYSYISPPIRMKRLYNPICVQRSGVF